MPRIEPTDRAHPRLADAASPARLRHLRARSLGPYDAGKLASRALELLVFLGAGVLLSRRFSGALPRWLSASELLLVGIWLSTMAGAARWLLRDEPLAPGQVRPIAARLRLAFLVWVLALGPSASWRGHLALVAPWLAVEWLASLVLRPPLGLAPAVEPAHERSVWVVEAPHVKNRATSRAQSPPSPPDTRGTSDRGPNTIGAAGELHLAMDESPALPAHVLQKLTRSRADSFESIAGLVRAEFLPGQRTVHVHVGFCPVLSGAPDVEFQPLGDLSGEGIPSDGTAARWKLVQALPHGLHWEVRLASPAPAEGATAVVEFAASAPAPAKPDA